MSFISSIALTLLVINHISAIRIYPVVPGHQFGQMLPGVHGDLYDLSVLEHGIPSIPAVPSAPTAPSDPVLPAIETIPDDPAFLLDFITKLKKFPGKLLNKFRDNQQSYEVAVKVQHPVVGEQYGRVKLESAQTDRQNIPIKPIVPVKPIIPVKPIVPTKPIITAKISKSTKQ